MRQSMAPGRRGVKMLGAVCAMVAMGSVAQARAEPAAQSWPEQAGAFSVTPVVGQGGGGSFRDQSSAASRRLQDGENFGVFLNMAVDDWRHYELFYTRQDTRLSGPAPLDIDVEYLQFGGSVSYPDVGPLVPYLGLTLGAARFSPSGAGMDSETRLAFSVGTGLRLPLHERLGLRLDVRALVSTFDTDGAVFCVAAGGAGACAIRARSSTLVRYSATVGVTLRF